MAAVPTLSENLKFLKEIFAGGVTQFLVAITTLLLGFVIGKIIGRIIERALKSINFDASIKKAGGTTYPVSELIGSIISYAIYAITILLVLRQLRLTEQVVNIVVIITIIIILLSLVLGAKDFTPNFMAGILLHTRKFIEEGDVIKLKDVEGRVVRLSLLETLVETKSKEIIYIPNALLVKSEIVKIRKKRHGEHETEQKGQQ